MPDLRPRVLQNRGRAYLSRVDRVANELQQVRVGETRDEQLLLGAVVADPSLGLRMGGGGVEHTDEGRWRQRNQGVENKERDIHIFSRIMVKNID